MNTSPSPPESISPENSDVVLEGVFLKQNRNRLWQERFFVFSANQVLSYYKRKGDAQPKASYPITRESGCKVSDLFVEERHKGSERELLYCISITFDDDASTSTQTKALNESFCNDLAFQAASEAVSPPNKGKSALIDGTRSRSASPPPRRGTSTDPSNVPVSPNPRRLSLRRHRSDDDFDGENSIVEKAGLFAPMQNRKWFRKEQQGPVHFLNLELGSVDSTTSKNVHRSHRRHHSEQPVRIPAVVGVPAYETISELPERRRTPKSPRLPPGSYGVSATSVNVDRSDEAQVSRLQPNTDRTLETIGLKRVESFERSNDGKGYRLTTPKNSGAEQKARAGKAGVPSIYEEQHAAEQDELHSRYLSTKRENRKKSRKRIIDGTKIAAAAGAAIGVGVLTAGVGLAAGLVFLGATAAAGGTAAGAEHVFKKSGSLVFASKSYEEAKLWKSSLDACLEFESVKRSTWGQMFIADGGKNPSSLLPHDVELMTARSREGNNSPKDNRSAKKTLDLPRGQSHLFLKNRSFLIQPSIKWRPLEGGWTSLLGAGAQGLRIYREERSRCGEGTRKLEMLGLEDTSCCPPLKAQIVLQANALDCFMCLMSCTRGPSLQASDEILSPNSGQRASFRTIEKIDDHMDVVHLFCRELYLFPSWTMPRDFVLIRYWRYEADGSYIVCYESVEHPLCPPYPGYIRGEMHQVCTLAPSKKVDRRRSASASAAPECLLTSVVQVDPKGWVPNRPLAFLSNQSYSDAFGIASLVQLLDIRDAIDLDRFLNVSQDLPGHIRTSRHGRKENGHLSQASSTEVHDTVHYDFKFSNRERHDSLAFDTISGIESRPPPLPYEKWAEPDANSFLVRGPRYKSNKLKINAGTSIGQLTAVDVVRVDKPLYGGMSRHPTERIQLALEQERKMLARGQQESDMPPFMFVVNIILPGPPFYHGVFYFAVNDMSTIDGSDGTGSSALCKKFLFGASDEFRDRTFKLIPQIVQGNFLVRKAVGNTPAIMGTKLKQSYVRDKRFMEVILDCGSSPVATGVIRLSLGYAKTLAIDMGFLLEADTEATLPERMFGCVRMKFPEFGTHLRKVEPPESSQASTS